MASLLKILHLIPCLAPGGAEFMLTNLLEGMNRSRFASVVVTTSSRNEPSMQARVEAVADHCHHLQCDAMLKPRNIRRIAAIIRGEKPDVVQTWMHKADLAGAIAARLAGVPCVSGIHSLDLFTPPGANRPAAWATKKVMSFGAKFLPSIIVSCSQTAIDAHAARGFPRRKMQFIGNGIDTARFQPNAAAGAALRAELNIPENAPVVGFIGRMAPVKDVPTFLRAAARVQREMPDAHFVLCGPDMDTAPAEVRTLIAAMPHAEHVHVIPFRRDVQNVYPAFTLLALTSQSEAYPMVLIEAMASGVPCCSTDAGDASLIIGRSGAVAPKGDDAAVAATWLSLLRRPADAMQTLKQQVCARARGHFSLTACVRQYEELYSVLSAAHRKPASTPATAHS